MDNTHHLQEKRFIEEAGIIFEQTGLPRMAGRIFGWLLISDPLYQSADQLAEALSASKGSISSMTRLLIQTGLVERFSLPGIRRDYFRLHSQVWRHMVGHGLEDEIKMFRQLAEHGLELLPDEASLARQRLEDMHAWYAFLEREFPALLERWEHERKEKQAA